MGVFRMDIQDFIDSWADSSPTITVKTSGSTGTPKLMHVEKERMRASARMTCRFLDIHPGERALLCLSADYIAGKMMVVRALEWGLHITAIPPTGHPLSRSGGYDFVAMVPLQVWNTLQVDEERERLAAIRNIIIGGGAVDDTLAAALRPFQNNIWSTYGMTETLSHIAMRRLSGASASEWYTPFDGVSVSANAEECLVIHAPSVCPQVLETRDIVSFHPDGRRFKILGRKDNVICSGGLKIRIEDVERLLQPVLSQPFCVTSCRDSKLGSCVVLLTESTDVRQVADICKTVLPRYWNPRHVVTISRIPMTETGKIARAEAQRLATEALSSKGLSPNDA